MLSDRLATHRGKLSSRLNIQIKDLSFRCLYLDKNWNALAHESELIASFKCRWNNIGFGNNDPGRQRDETIVAADHFDRLYPINPELPLAIDPGPISTVEALALVKREVPYVFRYSKPATKAEIMVGNNETVASILGKAVDSLGPAWQVTFLFGYVIMYEDNKAYAKSSFRLKRGGSPWIEH